MRKNINTAHIEGRIYQHSLTIKQVQNQASLNFGKNFISGELEVAVDEEGLNIIPVHFTYVTETTSKGNKNLTYSTLEKIINTNKTWVSVGKDEALKVRIDTSLALNDFYNGEGKPVAAKRNEGGYVTVIDRLKDESERNTFITDMVIVSVKHIDTDEEKNITEHTEIHGVVFDYKNSILPVDFVIENPSGMEYFESLGISNSEPLYTKVWGKIICKTIVHKVSEETAFGESAVNNYERKSKMWVVTGTAKNPYRFGPKDEFAEEELKDVLTEEELQEAIQNRQVYLAEVKKRADEYKANKGAVASTPINNMAAGTASIKRGNFNF